MKLYNSLTRKAEEIPQDGPITLYTCGPTVYNYAHIGNFRSYLFADSIYRSLKFEGRDVRWVMNITDVDDKTIKGTLKEYGENTTVASLRKYTDKYLDIFLEELNELNIDTQNIEIIRVADSIVEIQELVIELLNKGYAYKTEDGVFFSIEKYQADFADYGELVGKGFLDGKKVGARVKVDEYEKDNLSDFALWKSHSSEDGEIFWDHPVLGKGRPGWHIECSAINLKAFGKNTTTIHTGGVDLVFPHHTNEIAQSQPLYRPFVKIWAHCEHLQIEGKKMAKRDGNVYTLSDIAAKHDPLVYRYLCLQTDFRKQMNFTWESLEAAAQALSRLKNQVAKYLEASPAREFSVEGQHFSYEFNQSLSEDLNLPKALSVVWKTLDSDIADSEKLALLDKFNQVLGLDLLKTEEIEIPEEVSELLTKRETARNEKNFAESDRIRDAILALGFEVLDTPEGQKIQKK